MANNPKLPTQEPERSNSTRAIVMPITLTNISDGSNSGIIDPINSSPGLSDRFGVLNFGPGTNSTSVSASSSPYLTPRGISLPTSPNLRVIAMDETIAMRIEQERKRARGSIYSQRARDKTRVAATTARLQSEINQLHGEISNLDNQINHMTATGVTISGFAAPTSVPPPLPILSPRLGNSTSGSTSNGPSPRSSSSSSRGNSVGINFSNSFDNGAAATFGQSLTRDIPLIGPDINICNNETISIQSSSSGATSQHPP